MGNNIKVKYWARDGSESTAYIDEDTGEGEDKHSEIPVNLEWSDADQRWNQTDTWEWAWGGDCFINISANPDAQVTK